MDSKARRRRPLKIVAGLALIVVGAILALFLWVRHLENRGWQAMEVRVRDLVAESGSRKFERPVLRGEAIPGDAWEPYFQALKEGHLLTTEFSLDQTSSRSTLERYLEKYGSAIEHLREGVRRSVLRPPGCPPPESASILSHGFYFGPLARLMIQQSRMLRSSGDPRKAVELLLDLALFGADLSRNAFGYVEGTASEIRRWALDELRTCVVDRSLPQECLETLDRELKILEDAAPDRSIILSNNTALLGGVLLAHRDSWVDQPGFSPEARDWRHAFSKALLALDLFTHAEEWNRRAGAAVSLPWPEAVKIHQAIQREGEAVNDLLSFQALSAYSWSGWMRAHLAKTRLLRVAVRYRRTGELLSLDDPFGGLLQKSGPQEGRLQVWSLGAFGVGEPEGGRGAPARTRERISCSFRSNDRKKWNPER